MVKDVGAECTMIYGCARVSNHGQRVAAQVAVLRKHGAGKVFREMANGGNRVQLWRLQAEARRRRAEGGTLAELARSNGVGKSTISRLTFAKYILPQGSTDGGAGRLRRAHKFLSYLPER
jgi:hypothetical protein